MKPWRKDPTGHTWNNKLILQRWEGNIFLHLEIECLLLLTQWGEATSIYSLCRGQSLNVGAIYIPRAHWGKLDRLVFHY